MDTDKNTLPKRKSTRLKNFDYSSNNIYFVTVCTDKKQKLLCSIKSVGEGLCALPQIFLTDIGEEVNKSILYINEHYRNIRISKYVIMPNHIHMLVAIENNTGGDGTPPLQNIVGAFKSFTTNKYGKKLWQRSFHDHIIRNESDYLKIWNYIDTNPAKWTDDCFYIE